jgi:Domain of unknown function (DUF5617)
MPKIVLYDVDGALISRDSLGDRRLFFPEQTKDTFAEHDRKGDRIIVCSFQSSFDTIKNALENAGIYIGKIEVLGKEEADQLDGLTLDEKKENRVSEDLLATDYNVGVIVDFSVNVDAKDDQNLIHILVPTDDPNKESISSDYLQVPLLPTSILKERIKPEVEKIKSRSEKGIDSFDIAYLNNLYLRVTNLFKAPASYEKLYNEATIQSKTKFEKGISILRDYCKTQGTSSLILGKLHLFFSGHWDRHHTDIVKELLDDVFCKAKKGKVNTAGSAEPILVELKAKLIKADNTLNPCGSLARRIEFIQKKQKLCVIDIDDLNSAIKHKINLAHLLRAATI